MASWTHKFGLWPANGQFASSTPPIPDHPKDKVSFLVARRVDQPSLFCAEIVHSAGLYPQGKLELHRLQGIFLSDTPVALWQVLQNSREHRLSHIPQRLSDV
jgi:hypothetical protein